MTSPVGSTRTSAPEIAIERTDVLSRTGFRLSWGAVLAGLAIATALQIVLTMFGAAIGLAAYDPGGEKALGIGTAVWAIISLLIAQFFGGSTTGRLAGKLSRTDGFLHGTLLWALSTLLTVWLISRGIGAVVGTTFGLAGRVAGGAANAVATGAATAAGGAVNAAAGALANPSTDANIRGQVEQALRQTGDPRLSPESLSVTAQRAGNVVTNGPADNSTALQEIVNLVQNRAQAIDRNDVINIIEARTGRSRAEAEQLADRVTQAANSARNQIATTAQNISQTVQQEAPRVAENVASGASTGLWLALLGLGLSLGAAVFGTQTTAKE